MVCRSSFTGGSKLLHHLGFHHHAFFSDHCAKKLLPWFDGMLEANEEYFKWGHSCLLFIYLLNNQIIFTLGYSKIVSVFLPLWLNLMHIPPLGLMENHFSHHTCSTSVKSLTKRTLPRVSNTSRCFGLILIVLDMVYCTVSYLWQGITGRPVLQKNCICYCLGGERRGSGE